MKQKDCGLVFSYLCVNAVADCLLFVREHYRIRVDTLLRAVLDSAEHLHIVLDSRSRCREALYDSLGEAAHICSLPYSGRAVFLQKLRRSFLLRSQVKL